MFLAELVIEHCARKCSVGMWTGYNQNDQDIDNLPAKIGVDKKNIAHDQPHNIGDGYQKNAQAQKCQIPTTRIDP